MNSENNPNANASDRTQAPAPIKPDPAKLTEADHIARQQAEARAAISGVLADMKAAIAAGGDVREWTRKYPWIMAGGAILAGFAAGAVAVPSKNESFEDFWKSIKDRLTPAAVDETQQAIPPVEVRQKPSMLSTILGDVLKIAGPALVGMVTEAMARRGEPPATDGHVGNGNPEPYDSSTPAD